MKLRLVQSLTLGLLMLPLSIAPRGCSQQGEITPAQQACWAHYQGQINAQNHVYFEQICRQQP